MDASDDDTVTMPTANGGWCAPGLSQLWAVLPGVELPEIKMRRGGIQFPTNIVNTVRFFEFRVAWWRRWVVMMDHQKSWTHYGEPFSSGEAHVIARVWRRSTAHDLVKTLSIAAGKR